MSGTFAESGDSLQVLPTQSPYEGHSIEELQALLWSLINPCLMDPIIKAYAKRPKLHFLHPISHYFFAFDSSETGFVVNCHITSINSFQLEITVTMWHLNFVIECNGSGSSNVDWRLLGSVSEGEYDMARDRNVLVSLIELCADSVLEDYYS